MRWPKVVPAGAVCETPIHVVDWLPTLLNVATAKVPADHVADGVSLLPLLHGQTLADPRPLFWHMPLYDLRWGATPCAVIRVGSWKLIDYFGDSFDADGNYRPGSRVELFNLADDIGETVDRAGHDPERAAALQQQLRAWLASIPAVVPGKNPHFDPQRSFMETKQKQPWHLASPTMRP